MNSSRHRAPEIKHNAKTLNLSADLWHKKQRSLHFGKMIKLVHENIDALPKDNMYNQVMFPKISSVRFTLRVFLKPTMQ